MAQPPSEADSDESIATIFQDIDTWAGDHNTAMIKIFTNPSIDRTYVGLDVSMAFRSVLFERDDKLDRLPDRLDNFIAWSCISTKASDLYHRSKFLIDYLERPGRLGTERVEEFIQEIKRDINASPHRQISSSEDSEVSPRSFLLFCN
jgi:hypothetical protein